MVAVKRRQKSLLDQGLKLGRLRPREVTQEAGGEALLGEKTVTLGAGNPVLTTVNSNFSNQLKQLIEAKKFKPGIAMMDEITLAAKRYDEAEDRVVSNPAIR